MTATKWGLRSGPATYIGIHGRQTIPCRIVRFRRAEVVVRWLDGTQNVVHPEDLAQEATR
uniref:hypothetical protein n=1 Tax=Gordonia sp. B7-2 TaxID=3420932 RepID=UPI003D8E199E